MEPDPPELPELPLSPLPGLLTIPVGTDLIRFHIIMPFILNQIEAIHLIQNGYLLVGEQLDLFCVHLVLLIDDTVPSGIAGPGFIGSITFHGDGPSGQGDKQLAFQQNGHGFVVAFGDFYSISTDQQTLDFMLTN